MIKHTIITLILLTIVILCSACGSAIIEDPRISLAKDYFQSLSENDIEEAASYLSGRYPADAAEWDANRLPKCPLDSYIYELRDGDSVYVYHETILVKRITFVEIGGDLFIESTGGGAGSVSICD